MSKVAVIGGGAWGTVLASLLVWNGHRVRLWIYEPDLAREMAATRENRLYFPKFTLPENLEVSSDIAESVDEADFLLFVVPSHVARSVLTRIVPLLPKNVIFVTATKGIENDSLLLVSQIFESLAPRPIAARTCALSGPSFAREAAARQPTAVLTASKNQNAAREVQRLLSNEHFRVYTSHDLIGIQLGGAVKNVIAIAAGISDALGFGNNARAALITRGLAEMSRLGTAMGADSLTFAGLAGLGDLVLTCTGDLSRNRRVGLEVGRGKKLDEVLSDMREVAEGVRTVEAVIALGNKYHIQLPISEQIHAVLYEGKSPHQAVRELMTRELKPELGGY